MECPKKEKRNSCPSVTDEVPYPLKKFIFAVKKVKKALFVTYEEGERIETETRNQSADQQWYIHRKFRTHAHRTRSYRPYKCTHNTAYFDEHAS